MLVRTQILLEEKQKLELQELALATGVSMSEIARESISSGIKEVKIRKAKKTKKRMTGVEFLDYLAKNAAKGPGDSEYDKYAYDL